MSNDSYDNSRRAPMWVKVVIILCMLPVLTFPTMLTLTVTGTAARTFVWLYPFYVIAAGVCAWLCWPQRRDVMWILLALLLLSHVAMWLMLLNYPDL